ncbi:MAG: AraC family transcriptional regulator [Saccharofermentanales bacterium]
MAYIKIPIKEDIVIKSLVTIHYFEYAKDYIFHGESHDFWEIVYVDKGEIEVMADKTGYKLKHGEMIFHKPDEFHNLWANGHSAPNLVVVTFVCNSKAMKFFEGKIIQGEDYEKNLFATIITEAKNAYSSPLNETYLQKLERQKAPVFGSEQLIRISLESLLINLYRKGSSINKTKKISTITKRRFENDKIDKVIKYLEDNIYNNIKFDDVCRHTNYSKTNLKILFKSVKGAGAMEFYRNLRINEIKRLIREDTCNFTDIAGKMSFSTVHYFSRYFKKATGMTPTEYARSIKSKTN